MDKSVDLQKKLIKKGGKFMAKAGTRFINRVKTQLTATVLDPSTFAQVTAGDKVMYLGVPSMVVHKTGDTALVASLAPKQLCWYEDYEYCPYLGGMSRNFVCEMVVGTDSRTDGNANQKKAVDKGVVDMKKGGIGGCPKGYEQHPAFKHCIDMPGWFIPAINQLGLLCCDPALFDKYVNYSAMLHRDILREPNRVIWSSTEADAENVLVWSLTNEDASEITFNKTSTATLIPFATYTL